MTATTTGNTTPDQLSPAPPVVDPPRGIDAGRTSAQADRVVVLVDGEVAAAGPWDRLAHEWGHLAG